MRALPLLLLLTGCELIDDLGGFQASSHPCFGNRTDTLWVEGSTVYVGCGSTTEGVGLYVSDDRGGTWDAVPGFDTFRVSHVHRGPGGALYVAGSGDDGQRVVQLDGADPQPVFNAEGQVWNSFHVGTFLTTPGGFEVAESLTGSGLAWRSGGGDWLDGTGWATDGGSYQILDAVVHGDGIVAVGSTIIQPPTVFVQTGGAELSLEPNPLAGFDGELWSIHSDGDGLIAGGIHQGTDVGQVFWTSGDGTGPWDGFSLDALFDEPTWVRGVCRNGDRLVAVGELSRDAAGILVESPDGGDTWLDLTPEGAPVLTRCTFEEGELVVAGAEGYFGSE